MVRFSNAQVAEAIQPFWAALQAGEFITDAAAQAGTKAGHPLGGSLRWRAPASWTGSERALLVVLRARGDRAGPRAR